jgi:signal transduction histidine kinase/ligand-binding sensor domain-containing protein/ActR/RegA family two-component response regulator
MARLLGVAIRCVILGQLWLVHPVAAQEFPVHRYSEDDGLPSSAVWSITQDAEGRMVFASRLGVTFYDGLTWDTHGVPEGLTPADSLFVEYDSSGDLWVGTFRQEAYVNRYDGEAWTALPGIGDGSVDHTLYAFGILDVVPPAPVLSIDSGAYLWNGRGWSVLPVAAGNPLPPVRAMMADGERLWLGTDEGLWLFADGAAFPFESDLPNRRIDGIAKAECEGDRDPCLWVAGLTWVARVNRTTHETLDCDRPLRFADKDLPLSLLDDGRGGVFVGSPDGLNHLMRGNCSSKIGRINGLVADGAQDLFRDSDQNIWVADSRGVSKIRGFDFATFNRKHGLFQDEVSSILERPDGSIVLGHRQGLTILEIDETEALPIAFSKIRTVPFNVVADDWRGTRVLEMAPGSNGSVWIAAFEKGLGHLDARNRVTWINDDSAPPPVSSVVTGRNGRLWVLTQAGLLSADSEGSSFEFVTELPGVKWARRAFELRDGSIALGTGGQGLVLVVDGALDWISPNDSMSGDVFSLLEKSDGGVLVGTSEGLGVVRDDKIYPADVSELAPGRPVYSILEVGDGDLWLGTDNGVVVSDGRRSRRYTVGDGLLGRETNRDAALVDSRGWIWIGTAQGVTIHRPDLASGEAQPPRVSLLALDANERRRNPFESFDLSGGNNHLTFRFSAISMRDEKRIRVRSWLEGTQAGWSEADHQTSFRQFPGLSPGRYRFHLQAALPNGDWSKVVSSGWIRVRPSFWQRPWFIAFVGIVLLGIMVAGQRYVAQRQYAGRLEVEVEQRVRELQQAQEELSRAQRLESLGLLAGGIAHDFNNLLTVILGNLSLIARRGQQMGTRAYRDTGTAIRRARELTGQLIAFSRGGMPLRRPADLLEVVEESVSIALAGSNVRAEIAMPAKHLFADIDRGQIFQVLSNLLINAVQAMPQGGVVRIVGETIQSPPVALEPGEYVRLSVVDQGPGIEADYLGRVFEPYFSTKKGGSGLGLASAWAIVRRHDGLLTAETNPGAGAMFHVYLPSISPSPESERVSEDRSCEAPIPISATSPRVLVMDDDPDIREVTCSLLESLGYISEAVEHGEAAIASYRSRPDAYDAVILDLTVPGAMGGAETLRRLQEIDPGIRAIVASGYSDAPVMADYACYGFCAVLAKPFTVEQLAAALLQAIDSSPAR